MKKIRLIKYIVFVLIFLCLFGIAGTMDFDQKYPQDENDIELTKN